MTLGTTTQAYGDPSYWDNRYAQEPGTFDWYQKYPALAPLLHLYIPTHHRILVVGCGNSAFSEGMVDDGYVDVVNIDISSVAIEAMRKKCNIKMDVRDMSAFQTGSFEAVVDKEKLLSEESSGHKKWDLTSAIPLDDNGNSVEAALGKNPDVHYIYVCIKANSCLYEYQDIEIESLANVIIGLEQILQEAQLRWLRPVEICEVLRNHQKFHLTSEPPDRPPGVKRAKRIEYYSSQACFALTFGLDQA
ncbi:S-adenosyl-L-methionine-dependent methyltransferases superfamily protein [Actinidia rufa]|uniref:S-adenosyl-L-methionine-dependent methyltransferases superfamily protein n=1 Tax=Actinidia rufa TaxID=165716 RepID=A0A7J0GL98_9ERIC|nr:S-adenosyl-L-methionine-dependent methyltransferases superfamily protein [Actinidia rufa]